jgi:hypothetical protein
MCLYLVAVVGLMCANDPEGYVGGSAATGRTSQAEQFEGYVLHKMKHRQVVRR